MRACMCVCIHTGELLGAVEKAPGTGCMVQGTGWSQTCELLGAMEKAGRRLRIGRAFLDFTGRRCEEVERTLTCRIPLLFIVSATCTHVCARVCACVCVCVHAAGPSPLFLVLLPLAPTPRDSRYYRDTRDSYPHAIPIHVHACARPPPPSVSRYSSYSSDTTYLPTYLPAYLPTCLPACLPTCLPAYLPAYLPLTSPQRLEILLVLIRRRVAAKYDLRAAIRSEPRSTLLLPCRQARRFLPNMRARVRVRGER